MKFSILSRFTAEVLFECDADSFKLAIELAVEKKANLDGANLYGANLDGANLTRANLDGANLTRANLYGANLDGANLTRANLDGANLDGANLDGANLTRANLDGANLDGANLYGANLYGANLDGANLYGANLYGANLDGANLTRANLTRANLTPIRDDIWNVLSSAPMEVPGLRAALIAGNIDGTAYTGKCACLVGTLSNVRGCAFDAIPGLRPDSSRPAERFFWNIRVGHTPDNNDFAKLVLQWIDAWAPLAVVNELLDARRRLGVIRSAAANHVDEASVSTAQAIGSAVASEPASEPV